MRLRNKHGTTDGFKIGKGVCHPALFNLYSEYIMQNAQVDESQAEIKIARRNNHLRYTDHSTFMAENEEELKSLLLRMKKLA